MLSNPVPVPVSLGGYIDENTEKIGCWDLYFAPLALFLVKALPKDAEFNGNKPWRSIQKENTTGLSRWNSNFGFYLPLCSIPIKCHDLRECYRR